MFFKIVIMFSLFIVLFCIVRFGEGNDRGYVLNTGIPVGARLNNSVRIKSSKVSGNGLSVCSWVKLNGNTTSFIFGIVYSWTRSAPLLGVGIDYERSVIGANTEERKVVATDCNVAKNRDSWVHACGIVDQSSEVTLYFNGLPAQNYTSRNGTAPKQESKLSVYFGNYNGFNATGLLFQSNVYNRALTSQEVKDMHECKFIKGDVASWEEILAKRKRVDFKLAKLEEETLPCPNPPPYNQINCEKQNPDMQGEPGSSGTPGSNSGVPSSGSPSPGSNSGVPSSGSPSPGSNSGSSNLDPGPENASTGSGNSNPGSPITSSSSANGYPGSSMGSN